MQLFVGKHCIPCKNLKARLQEENIVVEQIIAEENQELAKKFNVKVLPTLVLDDGSLVKGGDEIYECLKGSL
jgi:thioredoxin-related protein|nr:MAG TPA: TRX family protein [Caudoviricetes sp.]